MSARFRVLAALLAVVALLPASAAHAAPPELPDQIAAAWRTDRIYVDPAMRPAFPKSELDRIRAASAAAGFDVFVALIPRTPYTVKQYSELTTLLQARVGKPGLYLVWTVSDEYWSGTEQLFRPGGLKGRQLASVQGDDKADNNIVRDRPAPKIVRTIQQAGTALDGRALPPIPAADLEPERRSRTGRSVTDKEDLSAYTGMGVGGILGFVFVLLATRSKSRRRVSKWRPADGVRTSGSPREVTLSTVRAQADRWIPKATRALRGLEKLRAPTVQQLDRRDDARNRLDAARTLRKAEPDDVLALAGAFVLARQAHQVAVGDELRPPCFFDPTHPSGTELAEWSDDTEVPACRTCAQTVGRGETPRGLRVAAKGGLFGVDRTTVPYWTLDPEDNPMVATGCGALSDDLAERVELVYGGVR
ncbi:hypothetical protein BWI15_33810 [Kribbella sp. ALI-6-A]|uniref:hypothetical protein n=1 Tax=Kribbella sp. ALI-6-A TaxID=1933817 RepID=UPI00097BAAC1|nr:hypothetical protein [Kribbella sp. ALI-6-A]ONI68032.1 hypothetical protein BWI15_33810 [Kribbella sp. ALI-6-A]